MGFGDVLAQTVVEKKTFSELNWKRTAPYASMGLFVVSKNIITNQISLELRFDHYGSVESSQSEVFGAGGTLDSDKTRITRKNSVNTDLFTSNLIYKQY